MQKIKKITLKNFKFFYGKESIDLDRKHLLLYGENGSGKSSIYWALYTFLQSALKTDDAEIRKYFEPAHAENLINRYIENSAVSSIVIEFEDEQKASSKREISQETINTKSDRFVTEITLGSDFIDHKVLSRIYAYYHKEEIDLFDFFSHHLMAFINFREELIIPGRTIGNKNSSTWWNYIVSGLSPKPLMNSIVYKDFQSVIRKFNSEFAYYLKQIEIRTNNLLTEKFNQKIIINFDYRDATYNDFRPGTRTRSWQIKPPKIIMTAQLITELIRDPNKRLIDSPQSFLNEAQLSSLALAMRLAILDEKFVAEYPKILVLDDMLMSMDMCNREFILGILFEKYLNDYQILFFTHQRGLFEDARLFIKSFYADKARSSGETDRNKQNDAWRAYWKLMEMYATENSKGIPVPQIQPYESSLQKALKYFKNYIDYNACGTNLRISLEEFFRSFLPHRFFIDGTGKPIEKKSLMLDGLLLKAREYFNHVGFDTIPLDKLDRYRVRSLNPSSHFNPRAEYFKKELHEVFIILDILEGNLNEPLLCKDNKIKFEIVTQGGTTFSYTAILLDDICLYQKSGSSSWFFNDTDTRGYTMIECTKNDLIQPLNHELHRCTLTEIYNKTIAYIEKSEVAIVQTDMYSVFKNEAGVSLQKLKEHKSYE